PGAVRRMANLRKLVRLAREVEAREGRDLRGLVDRVDELAGEGVAEDREGEAPVEGEALEAVRIMTMHRAKGLEFPVVCVADLGREPFTRGREHLRIGPGNEVGLRIPRAAADGTRGEWSARVRAVLSTPNGDALPAPARRPEVPATPPAGPLTGPSRRPVADIPPPQPTPLPVDHLSYSALEAYGRCGYRF